MARLTLACISLFYLQLLATLSSGLPGPPSRHREPSAQRRGAQRPSSHLQLRHPAPQPVVWKLRKILQSQRSSIPSPAMGHSLRNGPRQQSGHHRPRAQLLRVGCALGTCQVQNLSHRLWQLFGSAGPRDSVPVDPSSPHSYG